MSFTDEFLAHSSPPKTDNIERDIGDLLQISSRALRSNRIAPNNGHPLPKGPMPDYVEHKEGVNQVGKLLRRSRCPRIRCGGERDRSARGRTDRGRQ